MSYLRTLLKHQNPIYKIHKHLSSSSILPHRTLTTAPQLEPQVSNDQNKKPTHLSSQEAGSCETTETHMKAGGEMRDLESKNGEEYEIVKREKKAERPRKEQEEAVGAKIFKKLSPEVEMFVSNLYKEGYFVGAGFLNKGFDFSCFDDDFARNYIRCAAEKFGRDHQDIAKWLSGSHLKMVALFGCPTLERKTVAAAKKLRAYLKIEENTVCSKCVLKQSCKYVNKKVWGGATKVLDLDFAIRIIILYALEAQHPDLSVPNVIKDSAGSLLNEVTKLGQAT